MNQRNSPLPRRLLLAATLAAGSGTLWFVLVVWLGNSVLEAWPGEARPPRESLVVTADGTPLIQSMPLDNLSLLSYREPNGRVHDDVTREGQLAGVSLYGERGAVGPFRSRPGWREKIKVFMDEREPAAAWYFLHDGEPEGAGHFVGYERVSNRLIGYIGLSGFRTDPVPPGERIPVRGELASGYAFWSSAPLGIYSGSGWVLRPDRSDLPPRLVHVPSGNRLRLVDLSARTVVTIFEAPEPIVSVGVPTLASYSMGERTRRRPILVRTGQKIYKLDHQYHVLSTLTIPTDVDRQAMMNWYEAGDGRAVVECFEPRKAGAAFGDDATRSTVYRIAGDGTIRDSFELTLKTGVKASSERAQLGLATLGLPAPAMLIAVVSVIAMAADPAQDYPAALGAILGQVWTPMAGILAISSALAALAWRRGRAFGLSRREQAVWAGFVLLFGVPACVGFLLHRRWPVRELCPHCHAWCARDRDACSECGTPFPAPALKGIEIYA